MKVIKSIIAGFALLAWGTANAATVFAPTDGDVNFLAGDLTGAMLAIFDDSDQTYASSSLGVLLGDIVTFGGPNPSGNHIATNTTSSGTLTLTGSDHFILGLSTDGGTSWLADSSVTSLGANSYTVAFNTGNNVIEVDVQVIPVPAAVWLFGSGLIGLVGIARRKRS